MKISRHRWDILFVEALGDLGHSFETALAESAPPHLALKGGIMGVLSCEVRDRRGLAGTADRREQYRADRANGIDGRPAQYVHRRYAIRMKVLAVADIDPIPGAVSSLDRSLVLSSIHAG